MLAVAATVAGVSAGTPRVSAQVSGTWVGTYPGNRWSTPSNWTSDPLYPDAGGVATFGPGYTNQVVLDRDVTLSSIVMADGYGPLTVTGRAGSNRVTLTGARAFGVGANGPNTYYGTGLDFTLASSAGFVKTGPGRLWVNFGDPAAASAAAQPLKGDIQVLGGTLEIQVPFSVPANYMPLGDTANQVVLNGGALRVTNADYDLPYRVSVGPSGGKLMGTWAHNLTVSAPVSGGGALLLADDDNGYGNTYTFTADNPFTGALTNDAAHRLVLSGDGAFRSAQSVAISGDATFDYSAKVIDRLSDTAPLRLTRLASLTFTGNPTAPVNERVGPLQLARSLASITLGTSTASAPLAVTAASLDRTERGVLTFDDALGRPSTNASRVFFATPPAMVGVGTTGTTSAPVVLGVFGDVQGTASMNFATYTPAGGLRSLTGTEYSGFIPTSGTARVNLLLQGLSTQLPTRSGPGTVNSLLLNGTGSTLGGTNALTINSGMILAVGSWDVTLPLNFAGQEAILYSDGPLRISAPLTNANGLTTVGDSVTLSGANTFTGPVTLVHGRLYLVGSVLKNKPGPLGASAAPIVIAGASTLLDLGSGTTFERDIQLRMGSREHVSLTGQARVTGAISGGSSGELGLAGTLDMRGQISGDIPVYIGSGNTVRLGAVNTFTGGVYVPYEGRVVAEVDGALGTGPLSLNARQYTAPGTLDSQLYADVSPLHLANAVQVHGAGVIAGTQPVELRGSVDFLDGGPAVFLTNDTPVTISGPVNPAAVQFFGAAPLTFSGVNRLRSITSSAAAPSKRIRLESPARELSSLTLGGTALLELAPGRDKTLNLATLALTETAAVDLADNGLATAGATLATVRGWVTSGYAAGAWNGPGLRSSLAAANPGRYGVGYATAGEVLAFAGGATTTDFMGVAVGKTATLARYTVLGDANLDGAVDFDDLLLLAKHYNAAGNANPWNWGDFTYDGQVNFDDLLGLAKNYNGAVPAGPVAAAAAGFEHDLAAAFASVPEPSLSVGAILGAYPLARRRRRGRGPAA